MLTPPKGCIQVAFTINRATCCFNTSHSRCRAPNLGFRRVLLADSKRKLQPLRLAVTTGTAAGLQTKWRPGARKFVGDSSANQLRPNDTGGDEQLYC